MEVRFVSTSYHFKVMSTSMKERKKLNDVDLTGTRVLCVVTSQCYSLTAQESLFTPANIHLLNPIDISIKTHTDSSSFSFVD